MEKQTKIIIGIGSLALLVFVGYYIRVKIKNKKERDYLAGKIGVSITE